MSQNQSLPGTTPWTLGLGSMPCDQMAVIAGNPRPCRRVAYGCLQHPGPTESIKMAGRAVASQSTFLKKGKCLLGGESSPGPEPTAQHQAPYHTQGKAIQQFKGSTLPVSVISSAFEECPHGPQEFYTSLSWSAREPGISSSAFSMNT